VRNPKREVTYGRHARALELVYALAPGIYQRFAPPAFTAGNFTSGRTPPDGGNVTACSRSHEVDDGWRGSHRRDLLEALLAATGGALLGLLGRR